MLPASPNSQPELLFELLSAQHDGQLTAAEHLQLQQLTTQYPQQARQFQANLEQVSAGLRSLPRQALPAAVFSADNPDHVPWLVRLPERRGGRRARLTAIVSTLAVVGLLLIFIRQPPDDTGVAASRSAASTDSAVVSDQAAAAPALAGAEAVAPSLDAAAPVMAADQGPGTEFLYLNDGEASDNPQVQPLADAADWKVVLVRVGAVDRSDVKDRVGRVLQQHGLLLADTVPAAMPDWLAVVLSTDVLVQQSLVQAVSLAVDGHVSEWNPTRIRNATRDEIVAAVRRSLQSPTQTELARGEIYVAVRGFPADRPAAGFPDRSAEELAMPGNRVDFYNGLNGATGTAGAATGPPAAAGSRARGAAKVAVEQQAADAQVPASGGNVTLFVFEFPDAADRPDNSDDPGAEDKRPALQ